MIKNAEPISSLEFNKGLVTRSDFLKGDINASPNTIDVQWNFDASLHKRLGSSSTNTVLIGAANSKLNQVSEVGSAVLIDLYAAVSSVGGIRGQGASFNQLGTNGQVLALHNNSGSSVMGITGDFSLNFWVYFNTWPSNQTETILYKGQYDASGTTAAEYIIQQGDSGGRTIWVQVSTDGVVANATQVSNSPSIIQMTTSTWYNVTFFYKSSAYIGITVIGTGGLLSTSTASFPNAVNPGTGAFVIGNKTTANSLSVTNVNAVIDEMGSWTKVLTTAEITDLYGGDTGNTYSRSNSQWLINQAGTLSTGLSNYWKMDNNSTTGNSWASFDFGASGTRNLTIAAGTGIYASSNLGVTFFSIATSRTQNYQYFDRSKNVLIATSDSYDPTLYWAGSSNTFAIALAPNSAPAAKFSVNYNGFLVLLNSTDSNGTINKRRFSYADENLQLTDPYNNQFDLPSSDDDEITGSFVLYKFLYVSTRYRLFRLAFVGGNPDWSYLKVKDWGYVPRTVKIVSMQGGGQFALGMDWNHRLRLFDGFDDRFISDNVENDNTLCDFAMNKISYAGSGLVISHAELNPITQEYRLNVAIGTQSSQTTHALVLNVRNLAFYPYANQQWQTMCMAESNNQKHLIAADRSGFVYILDSGNLDKGVTPINDLYDSPPLFNKLPEAVSKGKQINFFFGLASCGTIFIQDRVDLSNQWSPMVPLSNVKGESQITGTENLIKVLRVANVPSTFNTWQFRITSSANTANPWELDRLDFFQQGFGIGKGNNG